MGFKTTRFLITVCAIFSVAPTCMAGLLAGRSGKSEFTAAMPVDMSMAFVRGTKNKQKIQISFTYPEDERDYPTGFFYEVLSYTDSEPDSPQPVGLGYILATSGVESEGGNQAYRAVVPRPDNFDGEVTRFAFSVEPCWDDGCGPSHESETFVLVNGPSGDKLEPEVKFFPYA